MGKLPPGADRYRVEAERLRWVCDPGQFDFETTAELVECPIDIIGQPRALEALEVGLQQRAPGYHIFVSGRVGSGRSTVVRRSLAELEPTGERPADLVYVHNFEEPDRPCRLRFEAGQGKRFRRQMEELVESLGRELPRLFESEAYRKPRAERIEQASAAQKSLLKDFDKRVQEQGFALAQVQMGPFVRSQVVPLVAGNPVDMDQLETLVEQGKFNREEFEQLIERHAALKGELEALSRQVRDVDRQLRAALAEFDHELARPLVEEAVAEIRANFGEESIGRYLDNVSQDLLDHLDEFRDGEEASSEEPAQASEEPDWTRFSANVVVDNSQTDGRPVIWENTPSFRNLFGTIDKTRTASGEWESDHSRIRAGSLLRADGGFLVLDAMDVLGGPGVWTALKRTLRHGQVEIQSFDPTFLFAGMSTKPEPVPIDVKLLMIGTPHIYRLLYALDEDFNKIFKVKADFATETPVSDEELRNFACLIHKRCRDDGLPPFERGAVAAVVERGARLAEHQRKLTTRFTEITDLIRESGYWARRAGADAVRAEHVRETLGHRVYRRDRIAEVLREKIDEGEVLVEVEGARTAQVNGLAVLDVGDHVFGYPVRITATTAMGRSGIIDIDRESDMSGSIHTKGVLILGGFLRERFAQSKPLTLTASLAFEQSYGSIDGDSASCAELYALLSSLAEIPIRQGIAVTGSVNQRGEVQPVGGVNDKIEGFYDLCRLKGLSGEQGVLMPERNLNQLMLRHDVVEAVSGGRFHVWAVSTIEQGLEILTGVPASPRQPEGGYAADSVFGRVDARLAELAESVIRYGRADS